MSTIRLEPAPVMGKKSRAAMRFASLGALAISGSIFACGSAFAQDAEAAPPATEAVEVAQAETSGSDTGLAPGEIVVTAERRSTSLNKTPVTIQVLTADRLSETGVSHLYDIAQVSPGVRMDLLGSAIQPTIRGITTAVSGTGNASNTALYLDGYYQPSNYSNGLNLADINQIEVVKGPQGTLFGRNATAGAIIITTADPKYEFGGKAELSYGMYDDKRANLFLTGGLAENVAASGSVIWQRSDGFSKSVLTGKREGYFHSITGRAKVMWEASDTVKFVLGARYSDADDPQGRIYRVVGPESVPFFIPGTVVGTERYTNGQGLTPRNKTKVWSTTLTSSFDFDWASLTSYTGFQHEKTYQATDLDGSSAIITDGEFTTLTKTLSQEFILTSPGGGGNRFNWNLGLNYFYQFDDAPFFRVATRANPNPGNQRASRIETNAYAAFFDGTYEVVDNLFLTGGARYSIERKDFIFGLTRPWAIEEDNTWKSFTPRAVIRYQITPGSNVYASYSKGFKSGTYNASSSSRLPVNPEKIDAWEVGYKLQDGGITWNSSAYYYKYKDLQVSAYNFLLNPPSTMLQNVGRAEIYGADTEFSAAISDNLRINLSAAYNHGRYKEFPGAIFYIPNPNAPGYLTIFQDGSGNKVMRSPEWSGNASLTYKVPTEKSGTFSVTPSLYLTSRTWSDPANQYSIPAYGLLDMTINWTSPDERWKVSLIGKNLTDKYYISYWDPTGASLMVADAAPRTIRGAISYTF